MKAFEAQFNYLHEVVVIVAGGSIVIHVVVQSRRAALRSDVEGLLLSGCADALLVSKSVISMTSAQYVIAA